MKQGDYVMAKGSWNGLCIRNQLCPSPFSLGIMLVLATLNCGTDTKRPV
jgi:hypothetical protein